MSHPAWSRSWKITTIVASVLLLIWTLSSHELSFDGWALLFAALVAVASFIRVEAGESSIGFEATVVFGATILFHDAAIALIAVLAGGGGHALYRAIRRKGDLVTLFYEPAQLAIAYSGISLLYTLAVARTAPPLAKVAGYILLLIGYLVVHLLLAAMRRWFDGDASPLDARHILIDQGRALLLVSPVVAIEVLLFQSFGAAGFAIAFIPVLLVAYAMRKESDAHRQNKDLVRRNRELSILTESATQILSAEGDEETLKRLMGLLSTLAKLKASAVVTWSANPDLTGTVYRFGECLPTDQEILRWVDSAGFAQSAPSRAFVFHNDLRRFPLSSGGATQVLLGIQTAEVIYGVLIFETEDPSILKTGSLNLLTLLVSQTALSLQDQLLRREMHEKTKQLEKQFETMSTILEVSNSLIGSFEVDAALTRIAEAIQKALGFRAVVFALLDPKKDEFVRRAHAGMNDMWEEARKKHMPSAEITAFFNQEFRVSNSYFVSHTSLRQSEGDFFVRPDEGSWKVDDWHENDLLLSPLMGGEQMIGYLSVRDPIDRKVPSIEQVRTLEVFAIQAVTALQSARQYDEIKRLTTIDALTPAFNHRYFQEALGKEIHRHGRSGHEFALAMLDIDNFKRYNDTFGHPVGDEILKGLVEELMNNARDSDVVSRYGGEEFAIIFAETPGRTARDAANRMRELVERREFKMPQIGRNLRITASIGVAIFPADGETSADLINRADTALYFAKKNGKNQVAMATDVDDAASISS